MAQFLGYSANHIFPYYCSKLIDYEKIDVIADFSGKLLHFKRH